MLFICIHARTLSVAFSSLVDGRINNVLLQTVPDISQRKLCVANHTKTISATKVNPTNNFLSVSRI